MNKYKSELPTQQPPSSYADRMGLHTTDAGVKVPLEQSIVTGVLFAFTLGAVLLLLDVPLMSIFKWMGLTAIVTATAHWIGLHRHWWKLTTLEHIFGDLNNDGVIGPPQNITVTVNKIDKDQHLQQSKYNFSTVTEDQIFLFCTKTRRMGKPISRREWTPKKANGFSDDEWRPFWKELVAQGLIEISGDEYILSEEGEYWTDGVIALRDHKYTPSTDAYTSPSPIGGDGTQ